MQRLCSRLLITLVLTALSLGGVWASADARKVTADGRGTVASGFSKPSAQNCSGEPDGNHTASDTPRLTSGRTQAETPVLAPASASEWARWIGKIWMARTLGVKL